MVRTAPITPAAARTGESHSRPQTWTGTFPAIFWMMALSWSDALSNCGWFLWLHTEPCSLCPVGLSRNWYYLLQPQPQPNHGAMEWNAIINSITLPIDALYSISIICWSTISLPHFYRPALSMMSYWWALRIKEGTKPDLIAAWAIRIDVERSPISSLTNAKERRSFLLDTNFI